MLGWINIYGNLDKVAPGKMLSKGIYRNDDGVLPQKNNRVRYEADINNTGGDRYTQRIVLSYEGLVFVTYDHYKTFMK